MTLSPSNAHSSLASDRRRYRGLKARGALQRDLTWGDMIALPLQENAIVSITAIDGGGALWLTSLAEDERDFSLEALQLPASKAAGLDATAFDARLMEAIAKGRGSSLARAEAYRLFESETLPGDTFVLKVTKATKLFVISPIQANYLDSGGGGSFLIRVQPPNDASGEQLLPDPLGKIREEWRVDRGTALAYRLKKGQFVQIIDVEGQQCSDFMAMRASSLDAGVERHIDSTVSRTMARGAYPLPGLHDKFFDQDMRPLLSVRQDTVGRHDTFALACTARGYEERGFPGHINCSDNITAAYAPYGIGARKAWPAVNFFFNSWIETAGNQLSADEAWSRPGDYVALQALTDLVCVSTACPDDVDPINGWNPTDIHLRIYEEDSAISRSVTWRAQPEDEGKLTRHSAFHPRLAALTASFRPARDLWMASHFDATGAVEEYWACKKAATLQDMSGLRKFDIAGPDAEALLQHCLTRDVSKLSQHRGFYALLCDERGAVLDDGTLFRLEPMVFRWCCGSEESALHLREQAERQGLNVRVRALGHKLVNLALQGPASRDILRQVVFTQPSRPALDNIKWFGFTIARLRDQDGPAMMLCRTGFTGELGYEVFCDEADALEIWDGLMQAGEAFDLVPMGADALNLLRIEAGLMIAGAEFGPDSDAMESGLGFAVDFRKPNFIGRAALERNASAVRRKLVGLLFTGDEAPAHGDRVFAGRQEVGVVTSACFSPQLGQAIAMARLAVENADEKQPLEVGRLDGHMKRLPCQVTSLPFLDPKREKARA